ncbi:hypothetical protein GCM10010191_35620 [Actinomadura vinacea]|uniref:Uncharacterized protein n=1 Tax=Actinomadura vinacea TaxID=115336 RepID=A0ABN3J4V6_9ACTN
MDLVKAWSIGLLGYVLGAVIDAAVAVNSGAGDRLTEVDGALLWIALPALVTFLLITLLTDLAHSAATDHGRPGRRAVAVLTVPVLATLFGIAVGLARDSGTLGMVTSALASSAGTAAGFFAATWWRRRASRHP